MSRSLSKFAGQGSEKIRRRVAFPRVLVFALAISVSSTCFSQAPVSPAETPPSLSLRPEPTPAPTPEASNVTVANLLQLLSRPAPDRSPELSLQMPPRTIPTITPSDQELVRLLQSISDSQSRLQSLRNESGFFETLLEAFSRRAALLGAGLTITTFVAKLFFDALQRLRVEKKVIEAEKQAFASVPESIAERTKQREGTKQVEGQTSQFVMESDKALQMGSLFNLYNKQIEKYQTQTQSRGGWSFIFAILAMLSGLALVIWGGTHIVFNAGWEHVAAGSLISTVGGALSAFITKTFLDVHRLSLIQLNNYFSQPVLNSHILTAQRLADLLTETG
jgi:hypothetical protein